MLLTGWLAPTIYTVERDGFALGIGGNPREATTPSRTSGFLLCERVMNHPVARDWLLVRWFTCVMLASTSSSRSAAEQFKALFSFKKFCKIFQIFCYIESSDACMEY